MNDETSNSSEQTPSPGSPKKPDGWELFCAGVLRTEFGRRPSQAVDKAMIRLAAEEAAGVNTQPRRASLGERVKDWLANVWVRPLSPAMATGLTLVVILAVCAFYYGRKVIEKRAGIYPMCVLTDEQNVRWGAKSPHPKVGDQLVPGLVRLESGVVELTFTSSSKVAVEGPAEFSVIDGNAMSLKTGKVSTYVPRRGRGFAVDLPGARVVDLGTRFGAMAGDDQSCEVDVFQGKVKLTPAMDSANPVELTKGMAMSVNNHGTLAERALSESAFPQPNLSELARPQNCGFDASGRAALGEVPQDFGYWSGLAYQITGVTEEITPANGSGMLRFLDDPAKPGTDSEVWQLVDMHPYKNTLARGNAVIDLSALFNRTAGGATASTQFGLTLAAFRGDPSNAKELWATRQTSAEELVDKVIATDDDPSTWERAAVRTHLPADVDFVIVELRAIAPAEAGTKATVFPGNFADLVDMKISTPMLPSSIDTGR